jgi:hypothetical protein
MPKKGGVSVSDPTIPDFWLQVIFVLACIAGFFVYAHVVYGQPVDGEDEDILSGGER